MFHYIFCLQINCVRMVDVGLEQVYAGIAWHYKNKQSELDRQLYSSAEGTARRKELGLWNDTNPIPPWKWRRDKRLEALRKRFSETGAKEKTYAMAIRMNPEQLKKLLNEAIWNAFEKNELSEEEFAVKFKVSLDQLQVILEEKKASKE